MRLKYFFRLDWGASWVEHPGRLCCFNCGWVQKNEPPGCGEPLGYGTVGGFEVCVFTSLLSNLQTLQTVDG